MSSQTHIKVAKTKFFQLRIEEDLKERIENLAQKRGISVAGLFRMLVLAELEKEDSKKNNRAGEGA